MKFTTIATNNNMKNLIKLTLTASALALLAACGGGGGGGGVGDANTGDNNSISALSIRSDSIVGKEFVALTPVQSSTEVATFIRRLINAVFPIAHADNDNDNSNELIAVDSTDVQPVFSSPIPIQNFSIPSNARSGDQLIAVSGNFTNLTLKEGGSIQCNVIVALVDGGEATCIYNTSADEIPIIPIAVIRDGNVDGYSNLNDSVYFVINKKTGGYSLYRYLDNALQIVQVENSGQITKMLAGDRSFYGFNQSESTSTNYIFGNAENGIDTGITADRIALYRSYVTFPRIQFDFGVRSSYFMLDTAQSLGFSEDFSIDCDNPNTIQNIAQHSYGAFWISATGSKLCETYELENRNEQIAFRIVEDSADWIDILVSDDVFFGITSINGSNTLIIEDIVPRLQSLGSSRSIDLAKQKLSFVDLEEAFSLRRYANGVAITGRESNQVVTRYFNTKTSLIETFNSPPRLLSDIESVHLSFGD